MYERGAGLNQGPKMVRKGRSWARARWSSRLGSDQAVGGWVRLSWSGLGRFAVSRAGCLLP
ncbi:unnamed protein product [Spirodela intermedia]|uniref:Uncharacterized protein n=1 Tax=Spirodela intermedia TaxID=51605 RepID=A0ABN7E8Q4_SPIIN|nr:unnamed protein product [Spirodela intermedia]